MDHRTHRAAHRIEGRPAAPGIALGPLVRLARCEAGYASAPLPSGRASGACRCARGVAGGSRRARGQGRGDDDAEAILSFQIALLEDENLAAPAFARIADGEVAGIGPGVPRSIRKSRPMMQADDPYFRARASDLRDLRDRVLRHLAGEVDQIVPAGRDRRGGRYAAVDVSRHRLARWRTGVAPGQSEQPCRHPRAIARRADDCRRRRRSSRRRRRCPARRRRRDF